MLPRPGKLKLEARTFAPTPRYSLVLPTELLATHTTTHTPQHHTNSHGYSHVAARCCCRRWCWRATVVISWGRAGRLSGLQQGPLAKRLRQRWWWCASSQEAAGDATCGARCQTGPSACPKKAHEDTAWVARHRLWQDTPRSAAGQGNPSHT
jgi:hypothetical protein